MTVEGQLRETLHDRSRTVTGWTDPASRVVRGVRRRKRRRLVARTGAAALTVLVIALAAGFVQRQQPRTVEPGEVVIANATGAEVAQAPFIKRRPPRPAAAACDPAQLSEVAWVPRSVPWDAGTSFGLKPQSAARCTLSGRPLFTALDAATGTRVEVPFAQATTTADSGARQFPATIGLGEVARVEIRGGACPAGQSPTNYRNLSLSIGGRDLPVPDVVGDLTSMCGAYVSDWFVEPPMQEAAVEAFIEAPATLRRGADFAYSISINNPAPTAFALGGCPVYQLAFDADGRGWRRMDCRISEIAANSSVRFELTGHVPADARIGEAKLFWLGVLPGGEIIFANLQVAGGPVTITD